MEIIIILLILSLLKSKPSNYLMCGIFAWTGDSVKKFSWDKFNILGMFNNIRGGDSCGRMINGEVTYGSNKKKDYQDFIQIEDNKLIKERIVIGHTRNASYGYAVTELNAQPVVVEEDGENVFILAHNGTIYNVDELKEKYPIKITGHNRTDSYVLAHIIYEYGFNVLADYQGSAALVMYDRRKFLENGDAVIYIFRGESKEFVSSVKESEERPLNLYYRPNNSIYISSEDDPLFAIGGDYNCIEEVNANVVYTIKNGQLTEEEYPIDRSNSGQFKKSYKSTSNSRSNYYMDHGFHDITYFHRDENYYPAIKETTRYIQLCDETLTDLEKSSTKITYKKGLYHVKGFEAQGCIHLDVKGKFYKKKSATTAPFYFINGVMIKTYEDYQSATREYNKLSKSEKSGMQGIDILAKYSTYPVWVKIGGNYGHIRFWDGAKHDLGFYSGELTTAFSRIHYKVKAGCITTNYVVPRTSIVIPKKLRSVLEMMNESIEEPFNDNTDIIRMEITHELATLLDAISKAKDNLSILGEGEVAIKTLIGNLDTINNLIVSEDDNIFTKKLNVNEKWEDLQEC